MNRRKASKLTAILNANSRKDDNSGHIVYLPTDCMFCLGCNQIIVHIADFSFPYCIKCHNSIFTKKTVKITPKTYPAPITLPKTPLCLNCNKEHAIINYPICVACDVYFYRKKIEEERHKAEMQVIERLKPC